MGKSRSKSHVQPQRQVPEVVGSKDVLRVVDARQAGNFGTVSPEKLAFHLPAENAAVTSHCVVEAQQSCHIGSKRTDAYSGPIKKHQSSRVVEAEIAYVEVAVDECGWELAYLLLHDREPVETSVQISAVALIEQPKPDRMATHEVQVRVRSRDVVCIDGVAVSP
jgi:hypothetical protein